MHKIFEMIAMAMAEASSINELKERFHASVNAFNLGRYTYQVVQNDHLDNLKNYFVTTYPKEWEEHYISQDYFDTDPLVDKSITSVTPFFWGEDSFAQSQGKGKKMILEASDFNLQHGITIPIRGPNNSFSIITLCSEDATGKEVKEVYDHYYKDLMIYGLLFHSSLLSLTIDNQFHPRLDLTNKELECLKWMCAGKSNNVIASIMGVSESTIKERNRNIFMKLNVHNKTEAMLKVQKYKIVEV